MIISMTGFGKASHAEEDYEAHVEIRSVNHRFFDLSIRLPKAIESQENAIRELVRRHIDRGRVNINISIQEREGNPLGLQINAQAVQAYKQLLEQLRESSGIEDPIRLDYLLTFSEIFTQESNGVVPETALHCVMHALGDAIQNLNEMRRREGVEIEKDLQQRIRVLAEKIDRIETISADRSEREFKRLMKRLKSLVGSGELDPSRLEIEVALLADRTDVTEECIRFRSHNTLFLEALKNNEPSGRKLNFLLQEMNREANTIGAKACDAAISHLVVEIKEEVEKLREQIQNIE